jgi:hypothetical protein
VLLIWVFRQRRAHAADWHDGQFAHDTHARFSLCLSGKSVCPHAFASHRLDGSTFIFGESIERCATDLPNIWK